jgi:hypothetical protein
MKKNTALSKKPASKSLGPGTAQYQVWTQFNCGPSPQRIIQNLGTDFYQMDLEKPEA